MTSQATNASRALIELVRPPAGSIRLRIWGSEVRILSGAPNKIKGLQQDHDPKICPENRSGQTMGRHSGSSATGRYRAAAPHTPNAGFHGDDFFPVEVLRSANRKRGSSTIRITAPNRWAAGVELT